MTIKKCNYDNNLLSYVSNINKSIYVIYGLKEEIIANIFARVSRNSKSFREHLLNITEEQAKVFHEKWVLDYGHSSIAELATIHFGIEKVSRLFSSILERSNMYLSIIEYSQRYQKIKQNDFYIPSEFNIKKYEKLKQSYIKFQNNNYNYYLKIIEILIDHYNKEKMFSEEKSKIFYQKKIKIKAFENARYILTLATFTNIGLTTNGRALNDALVTMLSSEYDEVKHIASIMKEEAKKTLPTLVKYAINNFFIEKSRKMFSKQFNIKNIENNYNNVKLLNYSSKDKNELIFLKKLIIKLIYSQNENNYESIENYVNKKNKDSLYLLFSKLMSDLGNHDMLPSEFKEIIYEFELLISESCYHQFLRHRQIKIKSQYPSIKNGIFIPSIIEKITKAKDIFYKAIKESELIFKSLEPNLYSHYTVTNAHYKRISIIVNLVDVYHLINLRLAPQAQYEIQELIKSIVKKIKIIHPNLIKPALDRLLKKYPNYNINDLI